MRLRNFTAWVALSTASCLAPGEDYGIDADASANSDASKPYPTVKVRTDLGVFDFPYRISDGQVVVAEDIAIGPTEMLKESAVGSLTMVPWPGGIIPYVYTSSVTSGMRDDAEDAMNMWEQQTPVQFRPYQNGTASCDDNDDCASGHFCRWGTCSPDAFVVQINRSDDPFVSNSHVGAGVLGFCDEHTTVDCNISQMHLVRNGNVGHYAHEFGHLVGLKHEQVRIDRDRWIVYRPECVAEGKEGNFLPGWHSFTEGNEYDFDSIMGYASCAFAKGLCSTCPPLSRLDGSTWEANREYLSDGDTLAVKRIYAPDALDWRPVDTKNGDDFAAAVVSGKFGPGPHRSTAISAPRARGGYDWSNCGQPPCSTNPGASGCSPVCARYGGLIRSYLTSDGGGLSPGGSNIIGLVAPHDLPPQDGDLLGWAMTSQNFIDGITDENGVLLEGEQGMDDVAISAPFAAGSVGGPRAGVVSVMMGSEQGGLLIAHRLTQNTGTNPPPGQTYEVQGDLYGYALASARGVPVGKPVLAVGAPFSAVDPVPVGSLPSERSGVVHYYQPDVDQYDDEVGVEAEPIELRQRLSTLDFWTLPTHNDRFGASLVFGDLNQDLIVDLVVGAPGTSSDAGAVYVYYGQQGPGSTVQLVAGQVLTQYGAEDFGYGDEFGYKVEIADFDGDSYMELAVSHPGESYYPNKSDVGRISLYEYSAGSMVYIRPVRQNAATNNDEAAGDRFGEAMVAINANGDNAIDLAVGAPGENFGGLADVGRVFVLLGPTFTTGRHFGASSLTRDYGGDRLGSSLARDSDHPVASQYLFVSAKGRMSNDAPPLLSNQPQGGLYVFNLPGAYPVQYLAGEPYVPAQCSQLMRDEPWIEDLGVYDEFHGFGDCDSHRTCRPIKRHLDLTSSVADGRANYRTVCSPNGPAEVWSPCSSDTDCVRGTLCYSNTCREMCSISSVPHNPFSPGATCTQGNASCQDVGFERWNDEMPIGLCFPTPQ